MRWLVFCSGIVLGGLLGLAGPLAAAPLGPLATGNQNPLAALYGLPAAAPADVVGAGQGILELRAALASSASSSEDGDERVLLDGESTRLTLAVQYGVRKNLELGLEVPYLMHRDGFLDDLIIDWHDFFQLPQGDRQDLPRDRLAYQYRRDGQTLIDRRDSVAGFGDLRLTGGVQLWRDVRDGTTRSLALRASLELPTGEAERLTGSGSTDLALWLSGAAGRPDRNLSLFGAAGALFMTAGDLLPEQQRRLVPFGSLGAAWQPWPVLALKLQFDGHGAFFSDSDLRELGPSVQLAMGGTLLLGAGTELDLGFSEDLLVDTAPDIVFHMALRRHF